MDGEPISVVVTISLEQPHARPYTGKFQGAKLNKNIDKQESICNKQLLLLSAVTEQF